MGAVYQAAALSKAFKVKPFLVRDAAVFPIQVSEGGPLAAEVNLNDFSEASVKLCLHSEMSCDACRPYSQHNTEMWE